MLYLEGHTIHKLKIFCRLSRSLAKGHSRTWQKNNKAFCKVIKASTLWYEKKVKCRMQVKTYSPKSRMWCMSNQMKTKIWWLSKEEHPRTGRWLKVVIRKEFLSCLRHNSMSRKETCNRICKWIKWGVKPWISKLRTSFSRRLSLTLKWINSPIPKGSNKKVILNMKSAPKIIEDSTRRQSTQVTIRVNNPELITKQSIKTREHINNISNNKDQWRQLMHPIITSISKLSKFQWEERLKECHLKAIHRCKDSNNDMVMLINISEWHGIRSGCLLNKKKLCTKKWWGLRQPKLCSTRDRGPRATTSHRSQRNKCINNMLTIEVKCSNKFDQKELSQSKHLQRCSQTSSHRNQIRFGQMWPHRSPKLTLSRHTSTNSREANPKATPTTSRTWTKKTRS